MRRRTGCARRPVGWPSAVRREYLSQRYRREQPPCVPRQDSENRNSRRPLLVPVYNVLHIRVCPVEATSVERAAPAPAPAWQFPCHGRYAAPFDSLGHVLREEHVL